METPWIVISPEADSLERYAAGELRLYLQRLFRVEAGIGHTAPRRPGMRFILGLIEAAHVRRAGNRLPALSPQGHLLRRVDADTMVLAGGSAAAVAWAVYELVERYGVRFGLQEDVYPARPGPLHLPEVDVVLEPLVTLRCWRQLSDLATGSAMWSLARHQAFTRQVFKLKFNGVLLPLWPQQPFIDIEVGGLRRRGGTMLFGQRFPIDADTIGGAPAPGSPFLDNPAFAGAETWPEMLAAGRRLVGGILEQARDLGMHTAIGMQPFEFPIEFRSMLADPTQEPIQLGGLTCAERGDLNNPGHIALARAHVEAYLDQWQGIDELHLTMPEFPQAERTFEACWQALDRKFDIERDHPPQRLLARCDSLTPGGSDRADREVKSTVAMLHFLDTFLAKGDVLERAASQGTRLSVDLPIASAPLFGLMHKVLRPDIGIVSVLEYTASRAVRRMHHMADLDAARVRAHLSITLQDDNGGWLPQVATESIHLLLRELQRLQWHGLITRYWPIGDLDPVAAYLARAAWDPNTTPRTAYEDHFAHAMGPAATEELCRVMRLLEDATVILDVDFFYLFFPVLGIMCLPLERPEPMPNGLLHVRAMYAECRRMLLRLRDRVSVCSAPRRLAYMIGRLDFAIGALTEKALLSEGSVAAQRAREAGDGAEARRHADLARDLWRRAVDAGAGGLRAVARVAHENDRACLLAYHHLLVREVRDRTAAILREIGAAP